MKRAIASALLILVAASYGGVPAVRAAQQSEVGFSFDAMVQDQFVVLRAPDLELRIREVVTKLAAASSCLDCQGQISIINDPLPNVFSGPGSHLYLTTGLLDLVSSKEELAAVLARELPYITRGAPDEYFRKQKNKKVLIDSLVVGGLGIVTLGAMTAAVQSATTLAEWQAASHAVSTASQVGTGLIWASGFVVETITELETQSTPSAELAERSAAMRRLRDRAHVEGKEELAKNLDREVGKLEYQWEAVVRRIRNLLPEYSAMRFPQPVAPSELGLKPDEIFVKYDVLPQETVVFAFQGNELVAASVIERPRTHLENVVDQYVESLSKSDSPDFDLGHELFAELLAPVLGLLDSESELIIAAAPPLDRLPFGALVARAPAESVSRGDGERATLAQYVDELWAVRYVYSAGVLKGIADRSGASDFDSEIFLAAVGDYSLAQADSSQSTEGQARECSSIDFSQFQDFPTAEFTAGMEGLFETSERVVELNPSEKTVREALGGQRFRFLSFAGHATASQPPYLLEPSLILSPAAANPCFEYNDSLLTMSEIAMLALGSEVAILTACSTATGTTIVAGEGTMSLARAFQAAGVGSVVGTLWPVYSGPALEFSRLFLARLRDGKSKIEALRLSRQDLRRIDGYNSPRHWAAFVLIGAS